MNAVWRSIIAAHAAIIVRVAFYLSIALLAQLIPVMQASTAYEGWPSPKTMLTAALVGIYQGLMNCKALLEAPPQKG